jgi:RNA polymerase sigma factor (sigma-70 family)
VQERTADSRSGSLPDLEALLRRAREGCPDSIQELFNRYLPHLLGVVRHQLRHTPRLRTIFDSDDFLQEARLALHLNELPSPVLQSAATLGAYLKAVAENKVHDSQRKYLQARRSSLNREVRLDCPEVHPDTDLVAHQPAVAERLSAEDEFQQLLQGLPFHHQYILWLLRSGYNYRETAEAMGLHERTVRRLVAHFRSAPPSKDAT